MEHVNFYPRLLGETCDAKLLTQHYKKHSKDLQNDYSMDVKSESAAIYVLVSQYIHCTSLLNDKNIIFQIVASLYMVMVVLVVGMNYKMKERKEGEDNLGELKEGKGRKVIQSSSVSFTERRGTFSSIVSPCNKQSRRKVDV